MLRILILAGTLLWGAATPFTERGKTDFDTFLQLLNPYGQWTKQNNVWLYQPFESYIPMTEGRWVYTDFGWYWQGQRPFSWATDHYGVWLLGQDNVWRWKPDGNWQPAKVEWRGTPTMIGWRPTPMNRYGEMTEPETERYARPEEWIFVPRTTIVHTFMASEVTTGAASKAILDKSETINHTFVAWREIDRDGPDPYDVYGVAKSFLAEQTPTQTVQTMNIGGDEDSAPIIVAAPAAPAATDPATAKPDKDKEKKPPIYTVMSLPDFYYQTKPNPLKLELYVYRPEIHQDGEGIQRRVDVWHNPPARAANREKVSRVLEHGTLIIDGSGSSVVTTSTTVTTPVTAPASAVTTSNSGPVTITATSSTPATTSASKPAVPVTATTSTVTTPDKPASYRSK